MLEEQKVERDSLYRDFTSLSSIEEFNYIYRNSLTYHTKFFVLFYLKNSNKKFSVVASKKVGNAVKRNFSKRRLRALFIDHIQSIEDGVYILVAKKEILTADFHKLKKYFLKSIKALKAKKWNKSHSGF